MAQPEPRLADLTEMMTLTHHLLEPTDGAAGRETDDRGADASGIVFLGQWDRPSRRSPLFLRQAITLAHNTGEHVLETEANPPRFWVLSYFVLGRVEAAPTRVAAGG